MNKKTGSKRSHDSGRTITTPSFYGSHSTMVVSSELFNIELNEKEVVCKDDDGFYITSKERLDSNLADPNRYSGRRKVFLKEDKNEQKWCF